MNIREETLEILKEHFGPDKAHKVLEFIESRVRTDVATEKDIYELKLEIERVRAELRTEIENNRSELRVEIEKSRTEIEKARVSNLRWSFAFWVSQMVLLAGILFKLLS